MRTAIGLAVVLILATSVACAGHGPVIDTGSKPPGVGGTISGMVSASGGTVPLAGRKVTAIDVATGARFEASTASNGGYTMKVPTGKYRLEVELRPGESLAEQPADTEINASDLDPHRDFTITVKPLV
jgi:hypothetical protein